MSGPFVCADAKVTELSAAVTTAGVAELDLALVLPGGAAGLDAAVDGVFADPRLRLRAVELPAAARDDITTAVADVAAALDRTPLAGAAAFIEVPAGDFTTAAARTIDDHRYRAKVRTGSRHAQAWRPQLWLGMGNREPLTAAGIYQMTTRRGRQCGLKVYPHRFRHHFSHTWLDRGGPEGDLMELNGWTSPQMLRRYGASARARRTYDRIMTDT
jgi:Phage integrase family